MKLLSSMCTANAIHECVYKEEYVCMQNRPTTKMEGVGSSRLGHALSSRIYSRIGNVLICMLVYMHVALRYVEEYAQVQLRRHIV